MHMVFSRDERPGGGDTGDPKGMIPGCWAGSGSVHMVASVDERPGWGKTGARDGGVTALVKRLSTAHGRIGSHPRGDPWFEIPARVQKREQGGHPGMRDPMVGEPKLLDSTAQPDGPPHRRARDRGGADCTRECGQEEEGRSVGVSIKAQETGAPDRDTPVASQCLSRC